MDSRLDKILENIGTQYAADISPGARNYIEVDIGQRAEKMGFDDLGQCYAKVLAVVPLKRARPGMKVRIDGRTFVNYGQLGSGIAVPGYVVRNSQLDNSRFVPNDSMILNFSS